MSHHRAAIAITAALLFAASGATAAAAGPPGSGPLRVTGLRTEHRVDPLGIDTPAPLLEWRLDAAGPRVPAGQVAYQIRAASSRAALERGSADVWDSGRVVSTRSTNVPFAGAALRSREAVAWQVRVWDSTGRVSGWSRAASWEMGLLDRSDWSAHWIENASYDYTQPDGSETPLPVFGKAFTPHGRVARARLYMTGLGMYATTLNGEPVSDAVLEPGQTTY